MFDQSQAPSHQIHASLLNVGPFDATMRCPRCDAIGPTDIKSINPGLCGSDIIVYQCGHCGAEHDGTTGSGPILYMS